MLLMFEMVIIHPVLPYQVFNFTDLFSVTKKANALIMIFRIRHL